MRDGRKAFVYRSDPLVGNDSCASIWLSFFNVVSVGMEHVHAFRGDKVNTAFTFGTNFGRVLGWLDAVNLEPELIDPSVWLRHFSLYGLKTKYREMFGVTESKASSMAKNDYKACAERTFTSPITLDMADGMLITEFIWRRKFK